MFLDLNRFFKLFVCLLICEEELALFIFLFPFPLVVVSIFVVLVSGMVSVVEAVVGLKVVVTALIKSPINFVTENDINQ